MRGKVKVVCVRIKKEHKFKLKMDPLTKLVVLSFLNVHPTTTYHFLISLIYQKPT